MKLRGAEMKFCRKITVSFLPLQQFKRQNVLDLQIILSGQRLLLHTYVLTYSIKIMITRCEPFSLIINIMNSLSQFLHHIPVVQTSERNFCGVHRLQTKYSRSIFMNNEQGAFHKQCHQFHPPMSSIFYTYAS